MAQVRHELRLPDGYAIVALVNGRYAVRRYTAVGHWYHLPPTVKRFCDAWARVARARRETKE